VLLFLYEDLFILSISVTRSAFSVQRSKNFSEEDNKEMEKYFSTELLN